MEQRPGPGKRAHALPFHLVLGSLGLLRDTFCLCLLPLRDRRAMWLPVSQQSFAWIQSLWPVQVAAQRTLSWWSCYWTWMSKVFVSKCVLCSLSLLVPSLSGHQHVETSIPEFYTPKGRAPCFSEDTASLLNVLTFCGVCGVYTSECL